MGYMPSKFKKKQSSVVAPSTTIKSGKTLGQPEIPSNNRGGLSNGGRGQSFIAKTA